MPRAAAHDRAGDRVQLERPARVEVLLHRRPHLAEGSRQQRRERLAVESRSLRHADGNRFAMAGEESGAPLRRCLHGAGRFSGGCRRQRERAEERELLPQHRRLVEPDLDLEPGRSKLLRDLVAIGAGSEVDPRERRRLAHDAGLDDAPTRPGSRRRERCRSSPGAEPRGRSPFRNGTTTAVPTRSGRARVSAASRSGAFGETQTTSTSRSRLCSQVDLDLEVAEHGAFDAEPAGVPRERLRPEQEDDVAAGPCQGAAQ